MTLEISSEQARHHKVWHGHGTPLGTGPLKGGSKLAFFGSRLRTAFRDTCRCFQCQALVWCKSNTWMMEALQASAVGHKQYRNVWRPPDCKLCRASARCFPHSWEDAKGQVETRQEAICYIDIMTSESSSEQARPHTVWHGHRTPLGTGPLRGGSKLAFFGSRLETAFSGYMSIFSVPGSCLMQVQYLNDGGLASFSSRSQA